MESAKGAMHARRARFWRWLFGILVLGSGLVVVSGALYGPELVKSALARQGITGVEVRGVSLGLGTLRITSLSGAFQSSKGKPLTFKTENVSFSFSWSSGLVLQGLRAEQLDLRFTLADAVSPNAEPAEPLDILARALQVNRYVIPTEIAELTLHLARSNGAPLLSYVGGVRAKPGELSLNQQGALTLFNLPGFVVPQFEVALANTMLVRFQEGELSIAPIQLLVSSLTFPAESGVQGGKISVGQIRSDGRALVGSLTAEGGGRVGTMIPGPVPFQISAQLRFDPSESFVPTIQGDALIPTLTVGIELSKISGHFKLQPNKTGGARFTLGPVGASLLGGSIATKPVTWAPGKMPASSSVSLSGWSLADIFQAYPSEALQGTGTLDGILPIAFGPKGLSIAGGEISARVPGGILKGDLSSWAASYPHNQGIALAAAALSNLHYSKLAANVAYTPSGDLSLGVTLQGSNPATPNPRPLNLNVTISENIPALLKTMGLLKGEGMRSGGL